MVVGTAPGLAIMLGKGGGNFGAEMDFIIVAVALELETLTEMASST
jgi:hypothetical protein